MEDHSVESGFTGDYQDTILKAIALDQSADGKPTILELVEAVPYGEYQIREYDITDPAQPEHYTEYYGLASTFSAKRIGDAWALLTGDMDTAVALAEGEL